MMMCRLSQRPADAAEAHMSMGKMECISNAAAKMTSAAVTCELTGAEVWTLAKTAIELFGPSLSRFANKSTSYGIDSTLIIDLTTRRDDGQFWDFGTTEDRERLEQMQQKHQTMPEMRELLNNGRVHLVHHWRLASTGDGNEQGFARGKTRWATSSSRLATLLAREYAGENRRVRLIGRNETIAGAMYSPRLVN